MERFIVIPIDDPRVPEDERGYDFGCFLFDTETNRIIANDLGEPEDQTFYRNWKWVPDVMNKLAEEIEVLKVKLDEAIEDGHPY